MARDEKLPSGSASRVAGDVAALATMRDDWIRHERAGLEEMLAASWVFRTQQNLLFRIESLIAPLGLTMTKLECLVVLLSSKNGQLGLNAMAESLGVHPTSITYAVDSLVDAGLVERVPHPNDRRRKYAVLTQLGCRITNDALDVLEKDRFGVQPIGDATLRKLTTVLQEMVRPPDADGFAGATDSSDAAGNGRESSLTTQRRRRTHVRPRN